VLLDSCIQCTFIYTLSPKRWFYASFFGILDNTAILRAVINTCMENKQKLQTLFDQVRDLGVVRTQYEFGILCGRDKSWLSSSKSYNRDASLGVLLTLAWKLDRLQKTSIEDTRRADAKNLVAALWSRIEERANTQKEPDANS